MKIRFTESVFQDFGRVGYDNVTIRYRIVEDADAEPSDFSVPESFTREQALDLASRMVRLIYNEGIGYSEAYNRLVGKAKKRR